MNSEGSNSHATTPPVLGWLSRVTTEVSQWAASMSWWRLIVLFLLILISSSIIGELLHLKHDRETVVGPHKDVNVTIGGKNGIRITTVPKGHPTPGAGTPPGPPEDPDASDAEKDLEKAIEKAVEEGLVRAGVEDVKAVIEDGNETSRRKVI